MKRRFLCTYLPRWSIDLFYAQESGPEPDRVNHRGEEHARQYRRGEGPSIRCGTTGHRPVLLYTHVANQLVVARCCPCAGKQGISAGTALSLAQAILPDAIVKELNALEDFKRLCQLARWAWKFTPLVAIDEELIRSFKQNSLHSASPLHTGLILDVTGTERLHQGEPHLLQLLRERFLKKRIVARFAIAPTVGAAWALSRFARVSGVIVESKDGITRIREALAPLPCEALRLSPQTTQSLAEVGIETLRQLFELPVQTLGARFGFELIRRLDQAMGRHDEVLHFARFKEPFSASRRFDIPLTSHESLRRIILLLLKEVFDELEHAGKAGSSFEIEISQLNSENLPCIAKKEFSLLHASKNFSHLSSVVQPLIENLKAENGIGAITIRAKLTTAFTGLQADFVKEPGAERDQKSVDSLLDHLTIRLGRSRITTVFFEPSYIPEKSFSYRPIGAAGGRDQVFPFTADRPPYLFDAPQPIKAMALLPDAAPAQIHWRGQALKIVYGSGPERIADEWWHQNLSGHQPGRTRDYFKLQDQLGRWLWVFRDNASMEWYLQGLWV